MKLKNGLMLLMLAMCFLTACESGLRGTYKSVDENAWVDEIRFIGSDKVEVISSGMVKEGTFKMTDHNKVRVTVAGDTQELTIDKDGCIDAGSFLGRFCKEK